MIIMTSFLKNKQTKQPPPPKENIWQADVTPHTVADRAYPTNPGHQLFVE